jgi:hypothetical protein
VSALDDLDDNDLEDVTVDVEVKHADNLRLAAATMRRRQPRVGGDNKAREFLLRPLTFWDGLIFAWPVFALAGGGLLVAAYSTWAHVDALSVAPAGLIEPSSMMTFYDPAYNVYPTQNMTRRDDLFEIASSPYTTELWNSQLYVGIVPLLLDTKNASDVVNNTTLHGPVVWLVHDYGTGILTSMDESVKVFGDSSNYNDQYVLRFNEWHFSASDAQTRAEAAVRDTFVRHGWTFPSSGIICVEPLDLSAWQHATRILLPFAVVVYVLLHFLLLGCAYSEGRQFCVASAMYNMYQSELFLALAQASSSSSSAPVASSDSAPAVLVDMIQPEIIKQ